MIDSGRRSLITKPSYWEIAYNKFINQ